jgi:hypothetical protein
MPLSLQRSMVVFPELSNRVAGQKIAEVCVLCNDARIEWRDAKVVAVGGPTEAALVVLAEKLGVPDPALQVKIHAAQNANPPDLDAVYRFYTSRCVPHPYLPPAV